MYCYLPLFLFAAVHAVTTDNNNDTGGTDMDQYVYVMRIAWYAWRSGYGNNPQQSDRLRLGIDNMVMAVMTMVQDRACDLRLAERVIADMAYQIATGTVPEQPPGE